MLWKLLPQVVAAILMLFVALLDYKWFDKRTRKFRRGRAVVFALVGVLIGVSIVGTWRDQKAAETEKTLLRNEIADLKGLQFGGDSYCYVLPTYPNSESGSLELFLLHEGQYPVFDVSIRIEDVNRLVATIRDAQAKLMKCSVMAVFYGSTWIRTSQPRIELILRSNDTVEA